MTLPSEKRIKPIKDIPNIIFFTYLVISFVLYHFLGSRYHDVYSFFMFMIEYIAYSSIPIVFVVIYNIKNCCVWHLPKYV
jgi:hypothetical protein